jgi:type IV secretion system protein VirB10
VNAPRDSSEEATPEQGDEPPASSALPEKRDPRVIEGDRGISSVNQKLSLQFRLSNLLAIGLMLLLGLGFLSWYYTHALARQSTARKDAQSAVRSKAQGEMSLPSLGAIDPPDPSAAEVVLGPRPALPVAHRAEYRGGSNGQYASGDAGDEVGQSRPGRTKNRQLEGPVFAPAETIGMGTGVVAPASAASGLETQDLTEQLAANSEGTGGPSQLSALLRPSISPAVHARVLPTQQMLLPKGAFIDCTLETAIDSSLPGLTTCVTATDTFGTDGKVVLLERGTKLVGETRGEVQQGMARIFVLWTEARTPTGVVVPLASPGTDELGRSGLPGEVNRHFLQRFGAAVLVSVIDGAVQSGNRGAVVYNPSSSQEVLTGILKGTIAIPPTVTKRNGDRIQILVARDLDFRTVYELRIAKAN